MIGTYSVMIPEWLDDEVIEEKAGFPDDAAVQAVEKHDDGGNMPQNDMGVLVKVRLHGTDPWTAYRVSAEVVVRYRARKVEE